MRWPLRRQIMLPLLAVSIASLAAVGGIYAQLAARQARDRIERQLAGVVSVLSSSNFPLTGSVLEKMRELSGAEFVVTDAAGAAQAASFSQGSSELPIGDEGDVERTSPLGSRLVVMGEAYFHRVTPLPKRAGSPDPRMLHALFPEAEYRRALQEAYLPPVIVGVAAVVAVGIVASVLSGRISRTTSRLGSDVLRMARGDFTPAQLPHIDDEIRDLSLAVNRTAEMLAEYERQVRRAEQMRTVALLGAGLAHEMRNAATGCRIALDLHAEACVECAGDESLLVAERQLLLMENQLQRFMRAGKSPAVTVDRVVDFASILENVWPLVLPAARHAGVELRFNRGSSEAWIAADDEALGQAIVNLLINAIEAVQQPGGSTPRRVEANLAVTRPGFAELIVRDNGPGPQAAVADALFTPFNTNKPEGVGLGLAVVKRVVEAHRGAIDWMRVDESTCFRIEIPLARKGACCV